MTLNFKVNKPYDQIFDYLTDMQKFVTVHPVIYKIEPIRNNEFLFFETLKFGIIPWSFTYPGVIEGSYEGKKVFMKATVLKLVKIEMTFSFEKTGDATLVREVITFNSIFPVKFLMEKIFTQQHKQLFSNIENMP